MEINKGDVIQKRKEIQAGSSLMHGYSSIEKAEEAAKSIHQHYNLPLDVLVSTAPDDLNSGLFAVIATVNTYVTIEAKVNWVVENEIGVTYADSGSCDILDMKEEEGWIVIQKAKPQYQSGVEHMSDEELRASIESLRGARIARPVQARHKAVEKKVAMSAQDKNIMNMLGQMSDDERAELMKKAGLL